MSSSGSLFTETLLTITNTKLEELSKKRDAFEKEYAAVKASLNNETHPLKRLCILLDGAKIAFGAKTDPPEERNVDSNVELRLGSIIPRSTDNAHFELDVKNVQRFLQQARYDPSISKQVVEGWEKKLTEYLSVQSLKFQYATLYGQLVTEWLSTEKHPSDPATQGTQKTEQAEEAARAKKFKSRTEWEQLVFESKDIDEGKLETYLSQLFGLDDATRKDSQKALSALRESVDSFGRTLAAGTHFDSASVSSSIQGLLSSDLLTDDKREVLQDFQKNNVILREISDVLNMRMAALESWSWGTDVPVEQRRRVNGKYDVQIQEDLLQAIFLQLIGTQWSVFFRKALSTFAKNKNAWERLERPIPKAEMERIVYYLGHLDDSTSLQRERRKIHWQNYFLTRLLKSERHTVVHVDGDEEADMEEEKEESDEDMGFGLFDVDFSEESYKPEMARIQARVKDSAKKAADEDEWDAEDESTTKNPMDAKQKLLHVLSTEMTINMRLHNQFTAVKSTFDRWNLTLPHDTILTVLQFLGVSDKWRGFFQAFLQAPLRFADQDPQSVRTRKRGIPPAHTLSDVFGETILFCLDLSINRNTGGSLLYRMFDEFWFWSPDHTLCVKAWHSVTEFADTIGVSVNLAKSGSISLLKDSSAKADPELPTGQIKWGFLTLQQETARFEIDQHMVDSHIKELRRQLDSKKSIFTWIQAWNTYATTFFTSNFGKIANCYGRGHVDDTLATHERIHRKIFEDEPSGATNVVEYLKILIAERFGVEGVPEGFLYFPIDLGGLELRSPFVNLLQIRDAVVKDPETVLDDFLDREEAEYRAAKTRFLQGAIPHEATGNRDWKPPGDAADTFLSFEEFVKYREEYTIAAVSDQYVTLKFVYAKLLEKPQEQRLEPNATVIAGLKNLRGSQSSQGMHSSWYSMNAYWRWMAQLYGPQMIERFGGLGIVNPGLLPVGMVSLFRGKRVSWE